MIGIIEYNAGNVASVKNALDRLGVESEVTDDIQILEDAEKIIFPGVGEASSAMKYLEERGLDLFIKNLEKPILGICLGMQLMCSYTEEGDTKCLGIFNNEVTSFSDDVIKPHIGWNSLSNFSNSKLCSGISEDFDVYFVHSFQASVNQNTVGICLYENEFSAILEKDNYYATQFHPEKSASIGQKILKNFIEL